MALALYRRYRPDTFEGVIGQDQVTVPLMRALDSGKLTHAYLFSGPRGCGKTSSARILARCINCAKGPEYVGHLPVTVTAQAKALRVLVPPAVAHWHDSRSEEHIMAAIERDGRDPVTGEFI